METWKEVLIEPTKEQLISSVLQEISNHRLGLPANDVSSQMVIHSLVIVEEYKKKNPLKVGRSGMSLLVGLVVHMNQHATFVDRASFFLVLFASFPSGWATTTVDPLWELNVKCLSQGHNDASPVRESNQDPATF